MGSFAGARLRVALGGPRRAERLKAGLVVAPTMHSQRADGAMSLRFGEGVEYGVTGSRPAALSIAGRPVAGRDAAGRPQAGVSTLGWVAIGVGTVALLVVAASVICLESNCIGSK